MTEKQGALAILVLLILVCCFIGSCSQGCGRNYSEGFRAGVVTKLSKKGLIWDSWEGQMLTGGMSNDEHGSLVPVQWDFSTDDEAVAKEIEKVALTGERVQLQYRQWFVGPIWLSTKYVVTKVERQKVERK